jgi:hypothetical protein
MKMGKGERKEKEKEFSVKWVEEGILARLSVLAHAVVWAAGPHRPTSGEMARAGARTAP